MYHFTTLYLSLYKFNSLFICAPMQLLKKWYIEEKHWKMHPEITSCETFPMNVPVTATLSSEGGPGWIAKLEGQYEVSNQ